MSNCSDGWCGACDFCYPQQVDLREEAIREAENMAMQYDHIVRRMQWLDEGPVEYQSYQDLVWYDWATERREELYEWLLMEMDDGPPEWEQGHGD